MEKQEARKRAIPRWVWLFAILCFAIPVIAIGGAIPTALGVGGGMYCIAVSRQSKKSLPRKLIHCMAMTTACWTLFMILAGGVAVFRQRFPDLMASKPAMRVENTQKAISSGIDDLTKKAEESIMSSEEARREIYAAALSMRDDIERATDRKRGLDTEVAEKQIEHIKKMHENRLEFATKFHKITREQLDEIIAEGDRKGWPID